MSTPTTFKPRRTSRDKARRSRAGKSLTLFLIALSAQFLVDAGPSRSQSSQALANEIAIPGTTIKAQPGQIRASLERHEPELLIALMTWASENSDLRQVDTVPHIHFSSAQRIAALHTSEPGGWHIASAAAARDAEHSVLAIYDGATQSIHLPIGWNGDGPDDLSILLHELVHYMQQVGAIKYECAQAREGVAYDLQKKWLALSGRDLLEAFELDPFTLLVRTRCFY